jgi:hypothetical protein
VFPGKRFPRFYLAQAMLRRFFKVAGSIVAFVIRYGLAWLVYDGDRR